MNTDNTQDGAEPSPASAGSRVVAWAVALGDKGRVLDGIYISKAKADEVLEWRNQNTEYGARLIPLYESPPPALTDEELKAIRRAAYVASEMHDSRLEAALGNLLERMK
jgi:hypothetical protein